MKDGVIKYKCDLIDSKPVSEALIFDLNHWRTKLYLEGLIGEDVEGIGYGNISQRINLSNEFIISGTQTGNLDLLEARHYSLVKSFNIAKNKLSCEGKIRASSESLTHAIIYESLPEVNCVIHIHNKQMWKNLLFNELTTSSESLYGSTELAYEIKELLNAVDIAKNNIIVLSGHEDGIFFFGQKVSATGEAILQKIKFKT